jgi:hypothetical protein
MQPMWLDLGVQLERARPRLGTFCLAVLSQPDSHSTTKTLIQICSAPDSQYSN